LQRPSTTLWSSG